MTKVVRTELTCGGTPSLPLCHRLGAYARFFAGQTANFTKRRAAVVAAQLAEHG